MSDMKRPFGGGGFGAFRKIRRMQAAAGRGGLGEAPAPEPPAPAPPAGPGRRNQTRHRDLLARAGEREREREQEGIRRREEPAGREVPVGREEPGQDVALVVQGRGLDVSARVVKYSSLFTDLMQLAESDQTAIPVPDFISKQIMLDLVEIVEKEDTAECAHLVLVSLSYLLDFLIAVDFLGFQEIKATVETRVKEHINDSTWKDVFHYTKDIIGLFNTSRHAVEHVCRRLAEGQPAKPAAGGQTSEPRAAGVSNQAALVEGREEGRDPYREDYLDFPATFFRVMLKDKMLNPSFKLFLLKLWVQRHPDRKEDIFSLVSALPYKDYRAREVQEVAAGWGLGLEAMEEVAGMERRAKEEKEREAEERKEQEKQHKRLRRGHLLHPGMGLLFEFGGDFGGPGPAPPPGDMMEDILLHF